MNLLEAIEVKAAYLELPRNTSIWTNPHLFIIKDDQLP